MKMLITLIQNDTKKKRELLKNPTKIEETKKKNLLTEIIFLDFFNFCWGFQKFPFFCVTLYFHERQ